LPSPYTSAVSQCVMPWRHAATSAAFACSSSWPLQPTDAPFADTRSPLKHGLLLGKYDKPVEFDEGDFRRNVEDFRDPVAIERYKNAAAAMRSRFAQYPEPVLHAVAGALLTDNPTACVLLGQRNPKQVEAAAAVGEALAAEDAGWVRTQYRAS
jgi:aryl-alcohol dehydrogenase-like predicted oxidoreductase